MAGTPNIRPIDAVTASVIQGALENIAVEMGWKLMRMSYSSIIRESEDFGAAIIDRHGRQLCESKHSTPLQSGPIPGYVKGMNQILEERGQTLNEGDVIRIDTGSSGGAGDPKQRDPALAASDLRNGYVTPEQAASVYGLDASTIEQALALK